MRLERDHDPSARDEAWLEVLAGELGGTGRVTRSQDQRSLERVLARWQSPSPRRVSRWLVAAIVPVLVAAVPVSVWVVRSHRSPALTYAVRGALGSGSTLEAGDTPMSLRFSDGSGVELAPHTSASLSEVGVDGATLALARGKLLVTITPRPHSEWRVEAGPYVVRVTGTRFHLVWTPEHESFVLDLEQGSVVIFGPFVEQGLSLKGGQRFVASVRDGGYRIARLDPGALVSPVPADSGSVEYAQPTGGTAGSGAPRPQSSAASPPARAAKADFQGVVDSALERGLTETTASASSSDLVALADAGRYVGRSDVARAALEAIRRRFPGTPEAHTAAFQLGRLSDVGSSRAALSWYDQYLHEAPAGPFASEALGRKLLILKRSGAEAEARATAREYLRRYPGGSYAEVARGVAGVAP